MTYTLIGLVIIQFLALCVLSNRLKKTESDITTICQAIDNSKSRLAQAESRLSLLLEQVHRFHMSNETVSIGRYKSKWPADRFSDYADVEHRNTKLDQAIRWRASKTDTNDNGGDE